MLSCYVKNTLEWIIKVKQTFQSVWSARADEESKFIMGLKIPEDSRQRRLKTSRVKTEKWWYLICQYDVIKVYLLIDDYVYDQLINLFRKYMTFFFP